VLALILMQTSMGSVFSAHAGHVASSQAVLAPHMGMYSGDTEAKQHHHFPCQTDPGYGCSIEYCSFSTLTVAAGGEGSADRLARENAWPERLADRLTDRLPPVLFRPPRT